MPCNNPPVGRPGALTAILRTTGICLLVLITVGRATPAHAHAEPLSYVSLHINDRGIDLAIEAPAIDLAHDLAVVQADDLLTQPGADQYGPKLAEIAASRLKVSLNQETLQPTFQGSDVLGANAMLRLRFHGEAPPNLASVQIEGQLFPYDPRHKSYITIFQSGRLESQQILDAGHRHADFALSDPPGAGEVIRQFVREGIHHIFIGPDHILFIIGLLLLGGSLRQLLKIVTTFTIAHSVTLVLATLNVLNPPERFVEPAIALSIVFVGIDSLRTSTEKKDLRLLFAFCFGFIHGFGFASVLRDLELPRQALGWSLLSFNVGVEIGQACIVLLVGPILAGLRWKREILAKRVVFAGSLLVTFAGAFWFVQRIVS